MLDSTKFNVATFSLRHDSPSHMFTDFQADTVGDAYVAVTGLPTCGTKATSESVTNIAHLALEMLGQLNNLDHENESMCEVGAIVMVL